MEKALNDEMTEERTDSRRIGPQWIMRRARVLCTELEDPSRACNFRARPGWLRRFCKRFVSLLFVFVINLLLYLPEVQMESEVQEQR